MMKKKRSYPIVVTEHSNGELYTAFFPNIPELEAQGNSFKEVIYQSEDILRDLLKKHDYPTELDPFKLELTDKDIVTFITIKS